MIRPPVRKSPKRGAGWWRCYLIVGAITIVVGALMLYGAMFRVLRRSQGSDNNSAIITPSEATSFLGEAAHVITDRLKWLKRCPTCNCAAEDGTAADPDAWLDKVNDEPPPMLPSHYGMVHGMEPWERPGLKVWDLHTIPTDDWYERAKKATDRCDLELHGKIQGAEHGLEDKVVWVTALFDLKRGEAAMGDFQRGMEEYYRRFQVVLDRGAWD